MVGRNEHSLIMLFHIGYCLTSVFVNSVNVWSIFQLVFCHDFQHVCPILPPFVSVPKSSIVSREKPNTGLFSTSHP